MIIKKKELIFLGITYKPNVSDIRNSMALDIIKYFIRVNKKVKFYDPIANLENEKLLKHSLKNLRNTKNDKTYIILVKHEIFKKDKKILNSKNLLKIFE